MHRQILHLPQRRRAAHEPPAYRPRVPVPNEPPEGMCEACFQKWLRDRHRAAVYRVQEPRGFPCPHWGSGELYRVAFVSRGTGAPHWLYIENLNPPEWPALYEKLCFGLADALPGNVTIRRVIGLPSAVDLVAAGRPR